MYFAVITIFPEMFNAITAFGITGRAVKKNQAVIECINPRDFTTNNYRRVDERTFGGGPGMVMMAEPLAKAITFAKQQAANHGCVVNAQQCPVVYLSPQGDTLNDESVVKATHLDGMILLCGRYEGIDERLLQHYVDYEVSIGDYVLTGGELPAMVLMDSVIRRLPDVLGDANSATYDSFSEGLLDYPHYTKPLEFEAATVPEVLLSGHHANIAQWRFSQQVKRTQERRPDLWKVFTPNSEQESLLKKIKKNDIK